MVSVLAQKLSLKLLALAFKLLQLLVDVLNVVAHKPLFGFGYFLHFGFDMGTQRLHIAI